ncbi:MAG: hypothetical protein ACRBG0_21730 [Lewinella sp.]|jgi:hypothetical protein|uniref:hypothetical protein n=1 Tax=Lewinella sp. TaxID=2004506 RepID=UPI003D6BD104
MATSTSSNRKRKKKAAPGRFACKIYFVDHVQGKPPYCMKTKDFEDRSPQKLAAVLEKFKGLVAGTRSTEKGANWGGRINWAAIYESGTKKIAEFRDWDQDGLPYWKDLSN